MSKPTKIEELFTLEEKEYLKNSKGKSFDVSRTSLFLWKNCICTLDKDESKQLLIKAHDITSSSLADVDEQFSSSLKNLNNKVLIAFG